MYDSPPSRAASISVDSSLYNLPRSHSHDVLPKVSPSSTEADGELYVFNTPSGTSSVEPQMRHVSISYDIPPTPGNTYQIPRTFPEGTLGQTSKLDTIPDIPPPRPPKPHPAHDRSENYISWNSQNIVLYSIHAFLKSVYLNKMTGFSSCAVYLFVHHSLLLRKGGTAKSKPFLNYTGDVKLRLCQNVCYCII